MATRYFSKAIKSASSSSTELAEAADGTLQDSLQQTDQAAGAVGNDNYIEQRSSQLNIQQNEHRHSRYRHY